MAARSCVLKAGTEQNPDSALKQNRLKFQYYCTLKVTVDIYQNWGFCPLPLALC